MNQKLLLTLLLLVFLTLSSFSQTKNEKEERIDISLLPKKAKEVIKALPKGYKRLKLYKETDGEKQSFEAKFKYKKRRYSIEFSTSGLIEDIEVITKLKDLEKPAKTNIERHFNDAYSKYKFRKIQKQYVYNNNTHASKFVSQVLSLNLESAINYEIIAEIKIEKNRSINEFTFNTDGVFISSRTLNPASYEHVLY